VLGNESNTLGPDSRLSCDDIGVVVVAAAADLDKANYRDTPKPDSSPTGAEVGVAVVVAVEMSSQLFYQWRLCDTKK